MAQAKNGASILLLVNTGTVASPVYTEIGSQKGITFSEDRDLLDASDKQTANNAKEYIPARYGSTAEVSGFYVSSGEAGYAALKAAVRNGTTILVRAKEFGSALEQAECYVTNLRREAGDQEIITVSFSLTVNGSWTAV